LSINLIYGKVPEAENTIADITGYMLMIGDSSVQLHIKKGALNERNKKHRLATEIVSGYQNKCVAGYRKSLSEVISNRDSIETALRLKKIDSATYTRMQRENRKERSDLVKNFILQHPSSLQSFLLVEQMAKK